MKEALSEDGITLCSIFKACGSIGPISEEEEIHHGILRKGLLKENNILGNALVDM